MAVSHNRQNLSRELAASEVDLYDANGRLDVTSSDHANKEIFSEANIVKLPGGGIDHAASLVKTAAAKAVVIARKK